MKAIERNDLVVGVEYDLEGRGINKAHFVGREQSTDTLFFMASNETPYYENSEGFIVFDTSGSPFFLES